LVTGNPGKRPLPPADPVPAGTLERPTRLAKGPGKVWDEVIARAFWLTWADGPKARIFCALQAQFDASPAKMISSRIAILKGIASDLGLDPTSRVRMRIEGQSPADDDSDGRFSW
jgi:hypothetical protein